MKVHQCQFNQLKIGATFGHNGNKCKKRSTMTADYLEYDRWFYFGQTDRVTTTNVSDIDVTRNHGRSQT